jgi:hypothetical protein
MRIGDAERNEMSEMLSKHYSDGRLDAAEFQERLDKAMSAKTRGELSGLLADLPNLKAPAEASPPPPVRHRPRVLRLVVLAVIVFWVLSLVAATSRFFWFGGLHLHWLLILLVVVFLWGRDRRHRHWR